MHEFQIVDFKPLCISAQAYALYAPCMYQPTWVKYLARARLWQADDTVAVYAALHRRMPLGMLVVRRGSDSCTVEGIAVAPPARGEGIGRALLAQPALGQLPLVAETDEEAVAFYRRCGFAVQPLQREKDGQRFMRYCCTRPAQAEQ